MTITLEQFQEAVSARRRERKHGARRYEADLIAFALEHTQAALARGSSVHAAAAELGISMMTLQSWQRRSGVGKRAGKLREVVVSAPVMSSTSASSTLSLTTSNGHVVSGLDVAQAAALLRALS